MDELLKSHFLFLLCSSHLFYPFSHTQSHTIPTHLSLALTPVLRRRNTQSACRTHGKVTEELDISSPKEVETSTFFAICRSVYFTCILFITTFTHSDFKLFKKQNVQASVEHLMSPSKLWRITGSALATGQLKTIDLIKIFLDFWKNLDDIKAT